MLETEYYSECISMGEMFVHKGKYFEKYTNYKSQRSGFVKEATILMNVRFKQHKVQKSRPQKMLHNLINKKTMIGESTTTHA